MKALLFFVFLTVLAVSVRPAEIHIPLFGGSITIRNNSDGSFTVGTQKKTPKNIEKHTKFTIINGTVADFEFTSNSTTVSPRKRPSQQRPKSDVLNALLSMFGRF